MKNSLFGKLSLFGSLNQGWNPLKYAEEFISSRSGLELIDEISGTSKADILLPSFDYAGARLLYGDKTRTAERMFDGGSYTIYMKLLQYADLTSVTTRIITFGNNLGATQRGISISISGDRARFYISDGILYLRPYLSNAGLNAITWGNGIFELFIQVNFADKLFLATLYNSSGVAVGTPISQSLDTFTFAAADNYNNLSFNSTVYAVEDFKKFTGLKTLSQCQDDAYTTDIQIHYPLLVSTADVSGNGNYLNRSSTDAGFQTYRKLAKYPLDYGYSMNRHLDNVVNPIPMINSKKPNGDKVLVPYIGGVYTPGFFETHEGSGSLTGLNMADCKIRFSNAFFDRSNATIWGDDARSADDYDAANVKDFHIDNLNQKTIYDWLNVGYKGRVLITMTTNSVVANEGGAALMRDATALESITLFNTDLTGPGNKKALTYSGDILAAVLSGGVPTFDVNGYIKLGTLKSTVPMFTIRIDDGYDNCYDTWRGVMNGLGVHPTVNIHSALVGTSSGGYDFMSWARLHTLISEGWEVCSSGMYDNDWNLDTTVTECETELATSKTQIEVQGITCNHLIPNKYGILRTNVRYWAKKYGFKTCHAGNIYGTGGHGTNPQSLDLFNLCAIACDLDAVPNYNMDKADYSVELAAVKAQIDLALANNAWAILYVHTPSANLIAAMTEAIEYAQGLGITNVTMNEGLANCKYL